MDGHDRARAAGARGRAPAAMGELRRREVYARQRGVADAEALTGAQRRRLRRKSNVNLGLIESAAREASPAAAERAARTEGP